MKAKGHRGIESTSVHTQNRQRMDVHTHTHTHTHATQVCIQQVNLWQCFSSLFEVVSHGRLQDCGSVSPTQTHAGSEGKTDCREKRQAEETVGVMPLLNPQTHTTFSHPYLWIARCSPCRGRQGSTW